MHLERPSFSWDSLLEYLRDLTVITSDDLLFAFLVGVSAQFALWATACRPRIERTVWCVLLLLCVVSVIYAVVSVQVFRYLQSPLTYPLLYLAGDVKNMRSSVSEFASATVVTALVSIPISYLALVWSTNRYIQPKRTTRFRVMQAACVVMLVLYVGFGRLTYCGVWNDRNDRRIAENPHWTFVASCLVEVLGSEMIQLDEDFPAEDLEDFQIVDERPGSGAPSTKFPDRPKNAIVLVLESTATQFLSLYGSPYQTTPRLEAEAANALVFDDFYCHVGLTSNALVAIGLSIYPGMTYKEYTVEHPNLPGTSVADVLRPLGYRTAFIHNGDLGYTNQRGFLSNRGFDTVWDHTDVSDRVPDWDFSWGVEDRYLVDGIFKWIDQDPGRTRPFFTLAWTIQAHHPYSLVPSEIDFFQGQEPPGNDGYHLRRYLNILLEVDRQIGRLLDGLRERGLADDTVVLITGDHGEAFGFPHETNGHGAKLYQENVNVPLIVWNPKLFNPGGRPKAIGGQVDLNPTVLDVLGVPAPKSWQGRSMLDPRRPQRAYFYAANDDYLLGMRENDWKYIYNATLGRDQLFNLQNDPQEQNNVSHDQPDVAQRLRQRLAAWLKYEKNHLQRLHRMGANNTGP